MQTTPFESPPGAVLGALEEAPGVGFSRVAAGCQPHVRGSPPDLLELGEGGFRLLEISASFFLWRLDKWNWGSPTPFRFIVGGLLLDSGKPPRSLHDLRG